jgi:hypothetical protein
MWRERCSVLVAVAAVLLWAGAGGADVIFDSYPKHVGGGYGFCGAQNFLNNHDYDEAQRFVVPADGNYVLDHVRLALDQVVGNYHGVSVCLLSEAASDTVPDVVLACAPTFNLVGSDPVDVDVIIPGAPVLQAGAAYWIACSTAGDAYIGWTISADTPGHRANTLDGGPWRMEPATQLSAWQVHAARAVSDAGPALPEAAFDLTASPNPFNPRTTIRFDLPGDGPVRLAIFDPAGRLVRTLVDENAPAGRHEADWDGRDASGREVASGCYLARLEFGGKVATVRMGLVR